MNRAAPNVYPGRSLGHLRVGDWPVGHLRAELEANDVLLNEHAERLFTHHEMLLPQPLLLTLVAVSPAELGLADGGCLPDIFNAAAGQGLGLCPLVTGPYLRLRHREPASSDPEMRRHRPPVGALHVASTPLSEDFEVPKGFYLRTVEGRLWLRGYRCDDEYVVAPTTTYVFATSAQDPSQ